MDITFKFRNGAHRVITMYADVAIIKELEGMDEYLVLSVPYEVPVFAAVSIMALEDKLIIRSKDGARIAHIAIGLQNVIHKMHLQSADNVAPNVSIRLLEDGDGSAEMVIQTAESVVLRAAYLYMLSDLAGRRIGDLDPYPVPDESNKPIIQTSSGGA